MKTNLNLALILQVVLFILIAGKSNSEERDSGLVTIRVKYNKAEKTDTLYLIYFPTYVNNTANGIAESKKLKASMGKDSLFYFKFPVNKVTGRFFIGIKPTEKDSILFYRNVGFGPLSDQYLPEPDDNIVMFIDEYAKPLKLKGYRASFSGNGSTKYNIQESLKDLKVQTDSIGAFYNNFKYNSENYSERIKKAKLDYLNTHRQELTDLHYNVLKADILYKNAAEIANWVRYYFKKIENLDEDSSIIAANKFRSEYQKYLFGNPDDSIPEEALVRSRYFASYIIQKTADCDFVINDIDGKLLYPYLKEHYKGLTRDIILTTYLLQPALTKFYNINNFDYAIAIVNSPYCLEQLRKMKDSGFASLEAYNFELMDSDGKMVKMSDFAGKVVLIDFWFTTCGACISYYKDHLSAVEKHFSNNQNVVFIAMSIDRNTSVWQKSIKEGVYTSEQAINLYTDGNNTGVIKYYNVQEFPTVILIGKDGKLLSYNEQELYDKETLIEKISKELTD